MLWELRCAKRDTDAEQRKMPAYEWAELRFELATSADRIASSHFDVFLDYQVTAGKIQQKRLRRLSEQLQKSHNLPAMRGVSKNLGLESLRDQRSLKRKTAATK